MLAAKNSTPEIIEILIDAGADVNSRDAEGQTPLMWAAESNAPEVVQLLLDKGANASLKDEYGKTAFEYAQENEDIKGTDVYWRLNDERFE